MSSTLENEQGNPGMLVPKDPYIWLTRYCGTIDNLEDLHELNLKLAQRYEAICGSLMSSTWFCLNPLRRREVKALPPKPILVQPPIPEIPEAILNCMEPDGALQVEQWSPPPPPEDAFVWYWHFVAVISPWINADSKDERVRNLSIQALKEELEMYRRLHTGAVLIRLRREHDNLAEIVQPFINDRTHTHSRRTKLWMLIQPTEIGDKQTDTWEWWLRFRSRLGNSENVQVCLELGEETRLRCEGDAYLRWMSESVAAVFLSTGLFSVAGRLPEIHKLLLRKFFGIGNGYQARVLLAPAPYDQLIGHVNKELHVLGDAESRYCLHLNFLFKRRMERKTRETKFGGRKQRDEIYYPLQPLSDNLQSSMYECFEADYRKYGKYMVAVKFALSSLAYNGKTSARVVVLGAGRGPIVTMVRRSWESLRASVGHCPDVQIKIYAVEKNSHAIFSLRYMNETEWNQEVEVVESDMRTWFPGWKADLVVSELIGGFGDNELSPECLDGASHLMNDETLSIPAWYQSVLVPVQAPKMLHTMRRMSYEPHMTHGLRCGYPTDIMWVTRIFDRFHLDVSRSYPAVVFRFEHPCPPGGNEKYGRRVLKFEARENGELTGFAGFMDVGLWASDHRDQDGVFMCTYPSLHSRKMHSWFPTFFPLQTPVYVNKGQEIQLEFWRLSDAKAVWYEWRLLKPKLLDIQNPNGRGQRIPLKSE